MKQLSKNATQEEIVENIKSRIKTVGIDDEPYTHTNIKRIYGVDVEDETPNISLYLAFYISKLTIALVKGESKDIPKPIMKQLKCAMRDGVLCLYTSAVAYSVSKIIQPEVDAKYYIGYVNSVWEFNLFKSIEIPSLNVTTFHSIITLDGKVIDVCYPFQNDGEEYVEDLIYGSFPPDVVMYGWDMSHELQCLLELFSSYSDMSVDEWILEHITFLKNILDKDLE